MNAHPPDAANNLQIVRIGLVLGVVMFGVVVFIMHRTMATPIASPDLSAILRYVFMGLVVASLAGILATRQIAANAGTQATRITWTMVGWGAGEASAMFGNVYYFMTRSFSGYILGFAILVVALFLIPIPRSDDRSY